MTFNRMSIAAVGALGTLALAACGPAEEATSADGTVTESVTSTADSANDQATETVTQAAEPGAGAAAGGGAAGGAAAGAAEGGAAQGAPAAAEQGSGATPITEGTADIGEKVDVYGEGADVCIYGDGFGLNTVAAGANTSCDFASATFHALTDGGNATYDNVRDKLPTTITVHSPVTEQDYQMDCTVDDNKIVTCRGGENASVFMY